MKVHLKALGCRLNEAELEQWSQQFQAKGYEISDSSEIADVLVLNTCAVTGEASRKSRNLINRLHRDNPTAKLIVTGCHSTLEPEKTAETLGVDLLIPNDRKQSLTEMAFAELALPTMPISATEPDDIALYTRGRHRAFIKIQDGCRYRCSFCIVTVARGDERSRSVQEIIQEVQHFHNQGIQEIILTGVHVGGYGADSDTDLFALVRAILDQTEIPRIRFASVEPWDLPDHFFSLFENPRVMPHIHLPLQSGTDSVLKRMARRCKTTEYQQLIDKARHKVPGFNVTTDIIAGFPGESDQEWQETLRFVEMIEFGHIHIFPYSPREGTKAARLPNQINKTIRQQRCQELAELAKQQKLTTMTKLIGSNQAILWEKPTQSKDGKSITYSGYTPNFCRVQTETSTETDLESRITNTDIIALTPESSILEGSTSND